MKTLIIQWNVLTNGLFPAGPVEYAGLGVEIRNISIVMQEVTITSKTDELITPELAFYLGMLVQSEISLQRR